MQSIRIVPSLCFACVCVDGGDTHTLRVYLWDIKDTPGRSSPVPCRAQVWRDNAENGGREKNKEVTGVATGTGPTVFKWKTIRNQSPPVDKMKPHGKQGAAPLTPSTCTHTLHAQMLPCASTPPHTNIHRM